MQDDTVNRGLPDLDGRRVIVTGAGGAYAGRGMGRAIATMLARAGASVVVADIEIGAAEATGAAIDADGGRCVVVQADVTSPESVAAMVETGVRASGGVDILVNHAGLGNHELLADTDDATWRRIIGVNLEGSFLTTRGVLPLLLDQGSGVVLNTASICALAGGRAGAAYTIAKHGLVGLTKSVAATYGRHGIRCNAVTPGRIRAVDPDGDAVEAPLSPVGPQPVPDEIFTLSGMTSPAAGTPEQVAAVVTFLASDAASYINGAIVPVDGGWIAT